MESLPRKDLHSVLLGLLGGFLIFLCYFGAENAWATHAATTNGEIENRPAPVFRRVCLEGSNAGNYCKEDTECPGSTCADRNVFNITVAVLYNAPAADITSIQNLITAMSASLFDVTDGQAEIGIATIHNDAISSNQADLVIHPSSNDTWWQANSGHYRTGSFMEVSINNITNPTNQGNVLAHEFSHLVFDGRDEYENRQPNCGSVIKECVAGVNAGNNCTINLDCPGSICGNIGDCPDPASGEDTCLMDGNGTEFCWGQADSTDLTDLTGGNHDPTNETEQSSCRSNRSCWDQVVWSWPTTFLKPTGAPDPAAHGATVNAPNFIATNDNVRVVLVLDESGSMDKESPTRLERLQVAANDFITTAENDTEIGIVSYSTNADSGIGHASVPITALGNNRSNWTNAVGGLNPDGWTNIGDGLQKAKDMIVTAGGVTANTYIVLMTDGHNNRPTPQATADADLQAKIADLLASGIPVYVTCTGGDLGLQSQCAEIANGTNGFYADSANPAKLPENFVDFHERITGYQSIDSVYGNFAKIKASSVKTIFVDEGSESVSFSLLWETAKAEANMILKDPDGKIFQTRSIPQGRYVRIDKPTVGDWQMIIDPRGSANIPFVARAYTHNRINNFIASLRKPSFEPKEEIYIYAIAKSIGGTVTKEGEKIIAIVTLPDGSKDSVELFDNGRDAGGHGDDMAGDGIFTGVYTKTAQKGAYGFHFKVNVNQWQPGEEAHERDVIRKSPRFIREVRISAGVADPDDIVKEPEDDDKTPPIGDSQNGIFFSTEEDFVTRGPKPPDGNPIISDGDLLNSVGSVYMRNSRLLTHWDMSIDLGLDAADVIDVRKGFVAFSTELDHPGGLFTAGDLLAINGAILPNAALLVKFDISRNLDLGLDTVHFMGKQAAIIRFLELVKKQGRNFWIENPEKLIGQLKEYGIDIWFSTEGTAPMKSPKEKEPRFLDGDLLSVADGTIVGRNAWLLPPSVPAGILDRGVDFGLDAYTSPTREYETAREDGYFSTEILFEGEPRFTDGDVLRFGNGVVATNDVLVNPFEPMANFLGLDALSLPIKVPLHPCAAVIMRIGGMAAGSINSSGFANGLSATTPQFEAFDSPFGRWVEILGVMPSCEKCAKFKVEYGKWPNLTTPPSSFQVLIDSFKEWMYVSGWPFSLLVDREPDSDGWLNILCSSVMGGLYFPWNTTGKNGKYSLRLTIEDTGGSQYVSLPMIVMIDNKSPEATLKLDKVPVCGDIFIGDKVTGKSTRNKSSSFFHFF